MNCLKASLRAYLKMNDANLKKSVGVFIENLTLLANTLKENNGLTRENEILFYS